MLGLAGYIEPMKEVISNRMILLNEFFVILLTYPLYPLTEFMTDQEMRGYVGVSLVVLAALNILINLGVVSL